MRLSTEKKNPVLGTFDGIEEAFNGTTKATINDVLSSYGIPLTIRKLIEALSYKSVHSKWNGKTVRGKVSHKRGFSPHYCRT